MNFSGFNIHSLKIYLLNGNQNIFIFFCKMELLDICKKNKDNRKKYNIKI